MNEEQGKNIATIAKDVRLTEDERAHMQTHLLTYILEHPKLEANAPDARLIFWGAFRGPLPAAILTGLLLIVSGGISFAAEGALPGDVLYPIKVSVNENMRLLLAESDEARAEIEIARTTRRLEEAEQLAQRSDFNTEARTKIERQFHIQTERLASRIAVLQESGKTNAAEELSSNFEAALEAHGKILTGLATVASTTKNETRIEIESLREKVKTRKQNAFNKRGGGDQVQAFSMQENDELRPAALRAMNSALKKIEEVRIFVRARASFLGTRATADADSRFTLARRMVSEGEAKLESDEYSEALRLFQQAYRLAEEIKPLVNAREQLDIRVPLNADVEDEEEAETSDQPNTEATTTLPGGAGTQGGVNIGL